MARLIPPARPKLRLTEGWQCVATAPDAAATPADLPPALHWRPARVPGTAASALQGMVDAAQLHAHDVWYRVELPSGQAPNLVLHGLATLAEIWLDDMLVARSDNMFRACTVAADDARVLHLCFRALYPALARRRGRARWRPRLAQPGNLRLVRTTLLGQMPGRFPALHAVGPFRAVEFSPVLPRIDLRCSWQDGDGLAELRLELPAGIAAAAGALRIGAESAALDWQDAQHASARLALPGVAPWWPHTHGLPVLHPASLQLGDEVHDLGRVGFRSLAIDRGADGNGFALLVNDQKIFCRGAAWIGADLAALPEHPAAFAPFLDAVCAAGMNMLRVVGIGVYEADAFYEACAERGILVWQDFMFANFDYPADAAFLADAAEEAAQFLSRTQTCPALAVLCGGSEVAQQAGMFGLPPAAVRHEMFDRVLPDVARHWRPDVPYVAHAPDGPGWSFAPDRGIAHYYGVGAYLRGLDDARRANVRFAAECLGFANVPDGHTLAALGTRDAHDPRWKAASPRDPGAAWDFDDVRDHYLTTLFNENAAALRMRDRDRYLDLSRAVAIEVMQAVFAEWRRPGSCCAGGIVWTLNDAVPGAGWGVLDAAARPKPAWHGLRGVLQPVQLLLIDEGLNGLDVHVLNETAAARQLDLELCCLRADGVAVARSTARLEVPARGARTLRSADLFDGFFDITAAYHFGPPAHEVTWATLRDAGGELVSTAAHFPSGPQLAPRDPGFSVRVGQDDAGWWLEIGAERFAQHVHIVADQFRAAPDWFHLPPGGARLVRLLRECEAEIVPEGYILALNAFAWKSFSGRK